MIFLYMLHVASHLNSNLVFVPAYEQISPASCPAIRWVFSTLTNHASHSRRVRTHQADPRRVFVGTCPTQLSRPACVTKSSHSSTTCSVLKIVYQQTRIEEPSSVSLCGRHLSSRKFLKLSTTRKRFSTCSECSRAKPTSSSCSSTILKQSKFM